MPNILADTAPGEFGTLENPFFGPLGEDVSNVTAVLSLIFGLFTLGAGILFLAQLVMGGFQYTSAGGDSKAVEQAQKRIVNGIIGLVIIVAAYFIVGIIEKVLGIKILTGAVIPTPQ